MSNIMYSFYSLLVRSHMENSYFQTLFFFEIKFIRQTLVHKITQASSTQFCDSSSLYCIVSPSTKVKFSSITMFLTPYHLFTIFHLVTTTLLSVSICFSYLFICCFHHISEIIWVLTFSLLTYLDSIVEDKEKQCMSRNNNDWKQS